MENWEEWLGDGLLFEMLITDSVLCILECLANLESNLKDVYSLAAQGIYRISLL
jgi:hypothetical protein